MWGRGRKMTTSQTRTCAIEREWKIIIFKRICFFTSIRNAALSWCWFNFKPSQWIYIWPQTQSLEGRYNLINSAFWSDSVPEAKLHFEVGSCHDLTVDFQNLQTVNFDCDKDPQVSVGLVKEEYFFSNVLRQQVNNKMMSPQAEWVCHSPCGEPAAWRGHSSLHKQQPGTRHSFCLLLLITMYCVLCNM